MVRTLLKPFSFLPALLLMYAIYNFSAQPAEVSSQLSFQVSCKIVETADYVFDANLEQWEIEDYASRIHFITRKLAHMTEYFALAVAVSFPLYVYGVHGIWLMLLAGMICVGFACGDEYHQSFVDGRSPSPKDVAIDSFGVFWGIILVRIIGWTGRKTIFRPRKKKRKKETEPAFSQPQYRYYQEMPPHAPHWQTMPQGEPYPGWEQQNSGNPRYYREQIPAYRQEDRPQDFPRWQTGAVPEPGYQQSYAAQNAEPQESDFRQGYEPQGFIRRQSGAKPEPGYQQNYAPQDAEPQQYYRPQDPAYQRQYEPQGAHTGESSASYHPYKNSYRTFRDTDDQQYHE